ncbi:TetR/AcrR family transcriptional regulator [Devosia nitrariae]|uniref:Macrolide 2'-phosphotransferase n=1 Tax=Devosia nitrariae TaxID=2071872 RepID=A0ABQ5W740_9HYPH|nr:helix-turn-helix domain-containing protein [Devosia nitrariae]GLQ55892.1 macrolide 2'-phosphotransferase [Devosia nitrariae]
MPRPKTLSDEDVLASALEVLASRGTSFTLSEVAEHVGLSRATLIQRFGDRDAILLRMAQHEVALTRTWLDSLPVETGPDALWRFLETIVLSMGAGEGFSVRVAIAALEIENSALRVLAGQRYALVQEAIAARLPDTPERAETAAHLHTVIAGASMQWVASDGTTGLSDFILKRLRWAIEHLVHAP